MRYVVDTNVFIDAFLDPEENDAPERFHGALAPDELLSAVVVHELRAGATLVTRNARGFKRLRRVSASPRASWPA